MFYHSSLLSSVKKMKNTMNNPSIIRVKVIRVNFKNHSASVILAKKNKKLTDAFFSENNLPLSLNLLHPPLLVFPAIHSEISILAVQNSELSFSLIPIQFHSIDFIYWAFHSQFQELPRPKIIFNRYSIKDPLDSIIFT